MLQLTAVIKQSITPLYVEGLFMILVLMTSAGVPIVAATKPADILREFRDITKEIRSAYSDYI